MVNAQKLAHAEELREEYQSFLLIEAKFLAMTGHVEKGMNLAIKAMDLSESDGGENEMTQKRCAGIFSRPGGGLDDHWTVCLIGGEHNSAHLLEVVYVERRNAVIMLGGVIQHLS